nr:reverse transcriptase domain, reverse transcriptase zinc-binding domain protein [Tanacetum cinerariifolium]
MPNGNNIWSVVRRLVLAASMYFLGQERNNRVFRDESRDWQTVYNSVIEMAKLKLLRLKVKTSIAVSRVKSQWSIVLNRTKMKMVYSAQQDKNEGIVNCFRSDNRIISIAMNMYFGAVYKGVVIGYGFIEMVGPLNLWMMPLVDDYLDCFVRM